MMDERFKFNDASKIKIAPENLDIVKVMNYFEFTRIFLNVPSNNTFT